jgi:hypothetical protein
MLVGEILADWDMNMHAVMDCQRLDPGGMAEASRFPRLQSREPLHCRTTRHHVLQRRRIDR